MVTGVGLSAPASCAAIRSALDNFQETRFMDQNGEWLMGSLVPLDKSWRGETKLVKMASQAIRECLNGGDESATRSTALLLCLPETERFGRVVSDDDVLGQIQGDLDVQFH